MAYLPAAFGTVVIASVLWEVFNDLFRPGPSGALSDWVARRLFNLGRRLPRLLPLAGPLALIGVIGLWIAGLVLGFALVYTGAFPADFSTSTGRPPTAASFITVLYFSFQTLITLGYGDLVPRAHAMQFLASVEALVGFGLLTASVSAIVLLYPALSRLRLLARAVGHLVQSERKSGIRLAEAASDVVLSGLARDVTNTRIDLMHFPIIYYFTSHDRGASLARWTGALSRIAADAMREGRAAHVRLAAFTLDEALADIAELLERRFVRRDGVGREGVFRGFARDHRVDLE
jgi:hypothetical protein